MKVLLSILFLSALIYGQVSFDIHISDGKAPPPPPPERVVVVEPPQGYEEYDCDSRADLIVISPNVIGFWVSLPSGRMVLRCRDVWYDDRGGRMFYGPWREDRRAIRRHDYVRYDDRYRGRCYPRYKHHHDKYVERRDDRRDNDRREDKHKNHGHDNRDHGHGR